MLYEEFCKGTGAVITPGAYRVIESVYMANDSQFPTKQHVYRFFKKHGMKGFEELYAEIFTNENAPRLALAVKAWKALSANLQHEVVKDQMMEACTELAHKICPFSVGDIVTYEATSGELHSVEIYKVVFPEDWLEKSLDVGIVSDCPLYGLVGKDLNSEGGSYLSAWVTRRIEAYMGKKTLKATQLSCAGYGKEYNTFRPLYAKVVALHAEYINLRKSHISQVVFDFQKAVCPFAVGDMVPARADLSAHYLITAVRYLPSAPYAFERTLARLGGRFFEIHAELISQDKNKSGTAIVLDAGQMDELEKINHMKSIKFADIVAYMENSNA